MSYPMQKLPSRDRRRVICVRSKPARVTVNGPAHSRASFRFGRASAGLSVTIHSNLAKSAARRAVNPRNFFTELKRRNVYKIAIGYGVVAWLLLQAASILFP